ncbi:hypothetical protein H6G45_00200 [Synechocystis sp. FACHB-383]|uniref:Uncharacterized protein n=1 Tax=Synechocystis salina LEGE 00031 TaxID=1828736 RepID=A0ABR9VRS2_9SYNC|nr:hypothetical protein [Synechocystis sp. FACHB-383]MBE9239939.1 hypothetical protein [Synechocystis salina LEGE 00041]MBE9253178.1 hypothetical protein [Synechocystis salina LEGE 00031]
MIKHTFFSLIFLLLQPDLAYGQDKILADVFFVNSSVKKIDNLSIDSTVEHLQSSRKNLTDIDNLQYTESIVELETSFEKVEIKSPSLESLTKFILVNESTIGPSVVVPSPRANLDLSSPTYQQIPFLKGEENVNSPNIDTSSPVNVWHLTDKYLTLSPISWHVDYTEPDVNNFPFGIGAAYDFEIINPSYGFLNIFVENSVVSVEFNVFRDSDFGYPSAYAGLSLRRNIFASPIQIGSAMGLLYTTQLQELSGSPVLPFMLPFVQTDFDSPINLRIVYIPSFADYNSQQFFFTLLIKIN